MGLIPDTNLLELLDFALSADTVNTVRSLRDSMDSGIEPLNLISQLACLITRILAGGYQLHLSTILLAKISRYFLLFHKLQSPRCNLLPSVLHISWSSRSFLLHTLHPGYKIIFYLWAEIPQPRIMAGNI